LSAARSACCSDVTSVASEDDALLALGFAAFDALALLFGAAGAFAVGFNLQNSHVWHLQ